ncbi:hypothetical protein CUMW_009100 [Citrus unshiu]|nr:hypothetical protein CUMW_009100 [Citrus unshiu]
MSFPLAPLILAIVLQIFMAKLGVSAPNIATDAEALLQLKARISLDPHNFFANNWNLSPTNTSASVCNWVGVTCSIRHGRVAALSLPNLSLGGTLPPHVGNLSFLVSLNISGNSFYDTLPNELWHMRRLKIIDFSSNSLSGSLPGDMCNSFTQLESFDVSSNKITGEFPSAIVNISSLKSIRLDNNSLSGSLPIDLCTRLPSLVQLRLLGNNITGRIPNREIPNEIGNLHNLKILDLGGNNIAGLIPSMIFNNSNMVAILLYGNHLSGHLPSSIYLPNLENLFLWKNNLSGIIPDSICNASEVTILELSSNLFSGLVPNTFGNCGQLQILNLKDNHLTTGSSVKGQSFYFSLTNCRHLRVLGLEINPLKGVIPNSIGNLSTSLENFYAGSSQLSGGIPVGFGNLSNLLVLSLGNNELAGAIPTVLGKLQKLQGLDLNSNKLKGFIPTDLCKLERLNTLLSNNNALQGQIPTCLANLTSLRYLDFRSNSLNSTIPSTFWSLKYILAVDFSLNSLSGSLPLDIGNLEALGGLNLTGNQLSGYIPSSIGNLKNLDWLALARNAFQGPIPQSFGSLISLQSLDLSGNNISGEIPKSLEKLSHLVDFNVSFNRLDGEIPSGGPFVNFTADSFKQNYALCGSSRLQVPPCKTSSPHKSKATKIVLRYILPAIATTMVVLALVIILIRRHKRNKSLPEENKSLHLATLSRISYHELQRATNGFGESNLLGSGSFGNVYKATLANGVSVAVKVFNLQEDRALKSFDTECEVMRRIRHRNLIKIVSSCSNPGFKALIMQYMPQGSLEKWLYSHNYSLTIRQRLDIMIDVASALEYLHHGYSTPIIHCDLKPNNVLLDDDMVAHLGDFGIAKLLDGVDPVTQTMTLATIGYMAPEYGSEGIVSISGDVYSFGILMMETFTRRKPTDEMFTGEMSLKQWVAESLPDAVTEVVDANLLSREDKEDADDFAAKKTCISYIMGLALKCSAEIPEERINLKAHIALDPQNFFAHNWNLSATTNTSSSNSVCNWVGVTCGSRHGRVTGLSIPNLGLGGTIPPHVANLSFLVSLNISGNHFHGTLPNELWHMSRLRIIDWSSNSISGNLFDDMCNGLTELESFDVSSNQITGQLPSSLGDCSKLKRLSVSFNELTGRIPQNIGNLTELMELYLNGNNLQGEFPPTIFNVSSLRVIVLANNSLFGSLPVDLCRRLPSLQGLNLRDCMTTGRIPKDIGNCSLLNYLRPFDNLLTGEIPHEIGNLQNLKLLDFGANNLTGLIPSIIFNNSNIEVIQLYGNRLSGNLPSSTGINLPNLLRLYLWGNNLSGVIPSSICNASKLTVLELSRNMFSGLVANTFGNCRQLQILNLAYNQLATGSLSQGQSFFSSLTNCRYLRYLAIQTNPWKGILPNSVGNLSKSLENFYAGSCELGGGILAEFALNLSSNRLNSTIPSTFWSLEYILVWLSSARYWDLKVLTGLYLSGNQLSCSIPSSINGLKDLTYLGLATNGFEGSIPESMGSLISLESLDLSDNMFFGVIPKSFEALSHLSYLNVSFNGLEGEIPSGGPFVNFTAESFMQNLALCGSSRLQVRPCKTGSSQQSKATRLVLRYILPAIATAMVVLALIIILLRRRRRNKSRPTEHSLLNTAALRRISYLELRLATNGFSESNLLGTGIFSSVYKATFADGMNAAIKVFNFQEDRALKSFDAECEVLRRIRHRNLVKIVSSCSNPGFKALILQYMPQGSLERWLYSHNYLLNIEQRLDIMIDVASALEYLHQGYSTSIIHCDLKPSNVLLDDDMVAHLGDFGIAKLLDGVDSMKQTMTLATIGYMAPEYGSEGIVSTSGDVYSFGILMMETLTRRKPTDEMFTGEMCLKHWVEESLPDAVTDVIDANLLSGEEEADVAAKKKCMSSVMSFALKCSAEIPEERMSIKDALVDLKNIKTKFLKDVQQA